MDLPKGEEDLTWWLANFNTPRLIRRDEPVMDLYIHASLQACIPITVKPEGVGTQNNWLHCDTMPLGHADIRGNEHADRAVKKALNCDVEACLIPHSDLKPLIATHVKAKWQLVWDKSINKLHDSGTKWPLATAVLATRGLHMFFYSRGNLPLNVLDVSLH